MTEAVVTIVVASGDDGAAGFNARIDASACRYDTLFPASSPYMVAVGATQGPESGITERVCQSNNGYVITSGGGFSLTQPALSHQISAINSYFSSVTTQPVSGYNRSGRAIPDVSLMGYGYYTYIGGGTYLSSGTSASAPAFAGMISLINAGRARLGQSTVGYINKALYASGGSFANDITTGNIKCTASVCCPQGFYASTGWDPASGFGSVDFTKLYKLFVVPYPSFTPTKLPSARPSTTLTTKPTLAPSVSPTTSPSTRPSVNPSVSPTTVPSTLPSLIPSAAPTVNPSLTPSVNPSILPTPLPTTIPSVSTAVPTTTPSQPTSTPSDTPSTVPSSSPTSSIPTPDPTSQPSRNPTRSPTRNPTRSPTMKPTKRPSRQPTSQPIRISTRKPTQMPTRSPTVKPTLFS